MSSLIEVKDFSVSFGETQPVKGVSFPVERGEMLHRCHQPGEQRALMLPHFELLGPRRPRIDRQRLQRVEVGGVGEDHRRDARTAPTVR